MCLARVKDEGKERSHTEEMDPKVSLTGLDQYKRDVSRVPTDHPASSQEAVTTATTRNLGGMHTHGLCRSWSLSRQRSRES